MRLHKNTIGNPPDLFFLCPHTKRKKVVWARDYDVATFTVRARKILVAVLAAVMSKPLKLMAAAIPETLVWILLSGVLIVHLMDL